MTDHPYLNLKIGSVEQYAMVVGKEKLHEWRNKGWLEYSEIGFPKEDTEAFMLYGEISEAETLVFNRPKSLLEINPDSLKGQKVIEASVWLGTYGMGGAGFFGLLLENEEYLTYAIWNSGRFVLVDNMVVESIDPSFSKSWVSPDSEDKLENLSERIRDSEIVGSDLTEEYFCLFLRKNEKEIKVEFVNRDSRVPWSVKDSSAFESGKVSDYLLFQHQEGILIV